MSEFVKMTKDGETIEVSPLTVENHKLLGWVVVEEAEAAQPAEAAAVEETEPEPEPKKPVGRASRKKSNETE